MLLVRRLPRIVLIDFTLILIYKKKFAVLVTFSEWKGYFTLGEIRTSSVAMGGVL